MNLSLNRLFHLNFHAHHLSQYFLNSNWALTSINRPSVCKVFLIPIICDIGKIMKFPSKPPKFKIATTIVDCSSVIWPAGYVLFALFSSSKLADVQKFENPNEYAIILPKMILIPYEIISFLRILLIRDPQKFHRNEAYSIKQLKTALRPVERCTFW